MRCLLPVSGRLEPEKQELQPPASACSVGPPRCMSKRAEWFSQMRQTQSLPFSMRKSTDDLYFIYLRNPSSGQLLWWHIVWLQLILHISCCCQMDFRWNSWWIIWRSSENEPKRVSDENKIKKKKAWCFCLVGFEWQAGDAKIFCSFIGTWSVALSVVCSRSD